MPTMSSRIYRASRRSDVLRNCLRNPMNAPINKPTDAKYCKNSAIVWITYVLRQCQDSQEWFPQRVVKS